MKSILAILTVAAALWAAFLFPLSAQESAAGCPAYDRLAQRLSDLGEDRIGVGLDAGHRRLELWARPDGRTWTVVIRLNDGTACIADLGVGWQPAPGEGA
ncbi:MAG: hypothetical protein ACREEE_12770 [Dongiaceae bacterium]